MADNSNNAMFDAALTELEGKPGDASPAASQPQATEGNTTQTSPQEPQLDLEEKNPENQPQAPATTESSFNLTDIPQAMITGIVHATGEIGSMVHNAAGGDKQPVITFQGNPDFEKAPYKLGPIGFDNTGAIHADQIIQTPEMHEADNLPSHLTEGISRFMTGWVLGGKLLKGLGWAKGTFDAARAVTQGAISDFSVFNEHEQRLSNLVQEVPWLKNPVTQYLAADPNDSVAEGRFKNVLEGVGLGALTEGVFHIIKATKALRVARDAGNHAEAAKIMAESTDDLDKSLSDIGYHKSDYTITSNGKGGTQINTGITETKDFSDALAESITSGDTSKPLHTLLNTSTFTHPDQIINLQDMLSKEVSSKVKRVTHEMSKDEAAKKFSETVSDLTDITGDNPDSIANSLLTSSDNVEQARVNGLVAKNIIGALASEAESITKDAIELSPEAVQRLHMLKAVAKRLVAPYKGLGSSFARALESYKIEDSFSKEVSDLLFNDDMDALQTAEAIQGAKNKYAISKLLAGAGNAVQTWRINAMLSSPLTHIINTTSTGFKTILTPAERLIGSGFGALDADVAKDALATYAGMFRGLGDSFRLAGSSMKNGKPILRGASTTLDTKLPELITSDADSVLQHGMKWLGNVVGLPTRFLGAEDEFFQQLNYRGKLYANATRAAHEAGLKPGSPEFSTFIEREFQSGFDSIGNTAGKATNKEAQKYANHNTFSEDLINGDTWLKQMSGQLDKFLNTSHDGINLLGKVFLPFRRTPVNLIDDAINHTPILGQMRPKFYKDIAAGGERRAQAVGQLVTGSMFWTTGLMLATNGHITGAGPMDLARRKEMEANGWKPYSLVWTDDKGEKNYFQISRFDPYATHLMLAADATEIAHLATEQEWGDMSKLSIASLTNNLSSKKYLTGMIDLADLVSGAAMGDADTRFFNNLAASFVPSVMKDLHQIQDPYLHEVKTMIDAVKNRSGYDSGSLPVQRNAIGQPIKSPILGLWSKSPNNPTINEMLRLIQSGADIPNLPRRIGKIDLTQFKNTDRKSAYDRLGELMDQVQVGGSDLNGKLKELMGSEAYKGATDPFNRGDADYRGGKAKWFYKVVGAYRDLALKKFLLQEGFKDAKGQSLHSAYWNDKIAQQAFDTGQMEQAQQEVQDSEPDGLEAQGN